MCKRRGVAKILKGQDPAAHRILEREQARARKMHVVRLDRCGDAFQCNSALSVVFEGLRLNAAEHGGTALFIPIGVRVLAYYVFVAPAAMRHQRGEIALGPAWKEQRALEAEALGDHALQLVAGLIV